MRLRAKRKQSTRELRQSIGSFPLRRERHWSWKTNWSQALQSWIRNQKFEQSADQSALHSMMDSLAFLRASTERHPATPQSRTECLVASATGGIAAHVALHRSRHRSFAAAGGTRRPSPPSQRRQLHGFPQSDTERIINDGRRKTGVITKTGNGAIRRWLTESARTYRFPARETHHMQREAENPSDYTEVLRIFPAKETHPIGTLGSDSNYGAKCATPRSRSRSLNTSDRHWSRRSLWGRLSPSTNSSILGSLIGKLMFKMARLYFWHINELTVWYTYHPTVN